MANISSFYSNRKFYADEHFPYGIDRSGEFTSCQANLLIKHGMAYKALAEGGRVPETPEEEVFVAVCQGKRAPTTDHEKVWVLFCTKTAFPKGVVGSPYSGSKSQNHGIPEMSFNDDFEL